MRQRRGKGGDVQEYHCNCSCFIAVLLILFMTLIVLLFTLFTEPRVGNA